MPSYIVGRKVVGGWREDKNDSRNKATEEGDGVSEKDDLLDEKPRHVGQTAEQRNFLRKEGRAGHETVLEEKIRFVPKIGNRFNLDCIKARRLIENRENPYNEFNKELYRRFVIELQKLIGEQKSGVNAEFTETATGVIPGDKRAGTFIRIQRDVQRYVLPVGFRILCQLAITRKFDNRYLFPKQKPKRKKQRKAHD